jgi:hypothetical protein
MSNQVADLRSAARNGGSRRVPSNIGNLLVGLRCLIEYAVESRAITATEGENLYHRYHGALEDAGAAQIAHQQASEPTQRFIDLLIGVLAAGHGHLAAMTGDQPATMPSPDGTPGSITAGALGWRQRTVHGDDDYSYEWQPSGPRIGWIDEDGIYLEPEASFAAVQRLAREKGEPLTISSKTLHKRLDERGLLATTDSQRGKLTVRRTIEGPRRNVLHLRTASLLSPPEAAQSALEAHASKTSEIPHVSSLDPGPDPAATSVSNFAQPAPHPRETPAQSDAQLPLVGPIGPMGPIPKRAVLALPPSPLEKQSADVTCESTPSPPPDEPISQRDDIAWEDFEL